MRHSGNKRIQFIIDQESYKHLARASYLSSTYFAPATLASLCFRTNQGPFLPTNFAYLVPFHHFIIFLEVSTSSMPSPRRGFLTPDPTVLLPDSHFLSLHPLYFLHSTNNFLKLPYSLFICMLVFWQDPHQSNTCSVIAEAHFFGYPLYLWCPKQCLINTHMFNKYMLNEYMVTVSIKGQNLFLLNAT